MPNNDSSSHIEIIKSILETVGVIASATFVYLGIRWQYRKNKTKVRDSEKDTIRRELVLHNKIAKTVQNSANRARILNELNYAVDEIFSQSNADRFLVLIAVNGIHYYVTVSVLYQWFKDKSQNKDAFKIYHNINIQKDSHYKELLKDTIYNSVTEVETKNIKGTLLGNIYEDEGIYFSRVYFIERIKLNEKGKDVLIYVSFATHLEEGFTDKGRTRMNLIIDGRIKKLVKEIILE